MNYSKYKTKLWIFVPSVALCALMSLMKSTNILADKILALEQFLGGDLYLHLIVAIFLGYLCSWFSASRNKILTFDKVATLLVLLSIVTVDELLQYLIPSREFSGYDILANMTGVLLGFLAHSVTQLIHIVRLSKNQSELRPSN